MCLSLRCASRKIAIATISNRSEFARLELLSATTSSLANLQKDKVEIAVIRIAMGLNRYRVGFGIASDLGI